MLQCFVIQCLLHKDHEELALNHEALNHEALKHKDHEALALLQCFIIQCFVLPMLMLRDFRASMLRDSMLILCDLCEASIESRRSRSISIASILCASMLC